MAVHEQKPRTICGVLFPAGWSVTSELIRTFGDPVFRTRAEKQIGTYEKPDYLAFAVYRREECEAIIAAHALAVAMESALQ